MGRKDGEDQNGVHLLMQVIVRGLFSTRSETDVQQTLMMLLLHEAKPSTHHRRGFLSWITWFLMRHLCLVTLIPFS